MKEKLQNRLAGSLIIADGALGTQLTALGGGRALPESLVLKPDGRKLLRRVHAAYIEAGAELLESNTFAANPVRLEQHGLAGQCEAINEAAVATLREAAAGREVFVVGAVGPLDLALAAGDADETALAQAYRRQMRALKTSGVDALLLETFSSLLEAGLALREAEATGLPLLFCLGGQNMARRHARKTLAALAELALRHGALAIGINCMPPYDLSQALPVLREHTDRPLMAFPNAGTPTVVRGAVSFDLHEDELCREAAYWLKLGAAVIGGCCGTAPEHIAALAKTMAGAKPGAEAPAQSTTIRAVTRQPPAPPEPNPIRKILTSAPGPLVSVEVKASLGMTLNRTIEDMKPLAEAGPDFFDVPDNPGASPGRDCVACSLLLQQRYGIPSIFHKTATQTNALHVQSYLLGAYDLGLRGVLAITGDPPSVGTFDRISSRVSDLGNSVELLRCLSMMREGELMNGQPLPACVDFAAGCAMAPTPALKAQTAWLEKKIAAGAEFTLTQPVFTEADYDAIEQACARLPLTMLIGIFPIISARQAAFLKSGKIPGIVVPDSLLARLASFDEPADQAKAGLEAARSLINALAGRVRGFYIIMPFHRNSVAWTTELVRFIKTELPTSNAALAQR